VHQIHFPNSPPSPLGELTALPRPFKGEGRGGKREGREGKGKKREGREGEGRAEGGERRGRRGCPPTATPGSTPAYTAPTGE